MPREKSPHEDRGPTWSIRIDDLSRPEIIALLREHLAFAEANSPPEFTHALDLEGLRAPGMTFWSLWDGGTLAGCGALRELGPEHGEIKSMRTASTHLRRGVASAMLEHILEVSRERGYRRLSLETGGTEPFAPALALYSRFGFERCGPFADYIENPFTVYMTLELTPHQDSAP